MYIWFSVVDCQDHVSGLTTKWSQTEFRPQVNFSMAAMRRHLLELGWLKACKACGEETPRPAMRHGRKYIINENDMKVNLNVIHWNCFICKTECDRNGKGEKCEELEHLT